MQYRTTLFFLVFLASCGKNDDTGPAEVEEICASSFTLTQANGETLGFDDCKLQGAEVNFAVAPDSIVPQLHRMSFIFRTSTDINQNCWVLWELDGICTERDTHILGSAGSTLTWNTADCDMPDFAKGTFEANTGGSAFTTRNVVPEAGLAEGDPMAVEVEATLTGTTSSGQSIEGTVVIRETLPLATVPYGGCQGANGDNDGDGSDSVAFGGPDCDDEDPQIGPHAIEVCDGIDNNCDGQIDEGTIRTFYEDVDGDGYGNPDSPIDACELPEGASEYDGDCNDNAPSINPSIDEVCDRLDNDCDGTVDDGVNVAIYVDADGDGYGEDPPVDLTCPDEVPDGHSVEGGDCNDDDVGIRPGVTEICDDDIDNDCDTDVDGEDDDCP